MLLNKVTPLIEKKDTLMRDSIPAGARLEATLRWLGHGGSFTSAQYNSRISKQSLSNIIPETCSAIFQVLKDDYLKTPCTAEEWKSVAQNFHYLWQFPNCIGALDGKYIEIVPPRGGGLVDANLEFLYADVGVNGRSSGAAAWDISQLKHNLERNTLNIPGPAELPNSTKTLPHVIVGDDAFPLKPYLLKPYSFRNQSVAQRIFSYRLSRAQRCVENAFGILANRFRVLLCPIYLEPEKVRGVVMACLALHNLLRKASPDAFTRDAFDSEDHVSGTIIRGSWRTQGSLSGLALVPRNASNDAKAARDQYCEYFNNEGSVPWQDNYM